MHCLSCGAPLRGRMDKRFCDDACRSGFHNQKYREQDSFVLKINKILKKNRKILAGCHDSGPQPVLARKLWEEGFLFGYCTQIEPAGGRKGFVYFCYEYGYSAISKTQVKIVRKPG